MESDSALIGKILESAPISLATFDVRAGRLTYSNGWVTDHLGYSKEELTQYSEELFSSIIHPEDRIIHQRGFESLFCIECPRSSEMVVRLLCKDGHYMHTTIKLSVLDYDKNQLPTIIFCSAVDISEIFKLKKRIDLQVGKLADVSFKNSHELRGPVATILGLIQLIEHPQSEAAYLNEIISSLKHTVRKLDAVIHEINRTTYE